VVETDSDTSLGLEQTYHRRKRTSTNDKIHKMDTNKGRRRDDAETTNWLQTSNSTPRRYIYIFFFFLKKRENTERKKNGKLC